MRKAMAEYIDRAAIIAEVEANKLMAREPAAKRILGMLRDFPAADVAPVVHGQWIPISDGDCAECSECGEFYETGDAGMVSFGLFLRSHKLCPTCGARMVDDT